MSTTFTPGPTPNTVRAADGNVLSVPEGWILLPPGDAALTRRVKAAGDHWVVAEKKGRKVFSRHLGLIGDHREDSCRSRSRAIYREFPKEEGVRCQTPREDTGG